MNNTKQITSEKNIDKMNKKNKSTSPETMWQSLKKSDYLPGSDISNAVLAKLTRAEMIEDLVNLIKGFKEAGVSELIRPDIAGLMEIDVNKLTKSEVLEAYIEIKAEAARIYEVEIQKQKEKEQQKRAEEQQKYAVMKAEAARIYEIEQQKKKEENKTKREKWMREHPVIRKTIKVTMIILSIFFALCGIALWTEETTTSIIFWGICGYCIYVIYRFLGKPK